MKNFHGCNFTGFLWNEQCVTNPQKLQFVHSIQQFIIHKNKNCSFHGDHENYMVAAWRQKYEYWAFNGFFLAIWNIIYYYWAGHTQCWLVTFIPFAIQLANAVCYCSLTEPVGFRYIQNHQVYCNLAFIELFWYIAKKSSILIDIQKLFPFHLGAYIPCKDSLFIVLANKIFVIDLLY